MTSTYYLGMKGVHTYEPRNLLSVEIIRMWRPAQFAEIVHFSLENVKIPEEINLQEALKQADAVSCDYGCSKDYILNLFKKKGGLIGWLERKIARIDVKDYEMSKDCPYTTFNAIKEIPGYEKIATITRLRDDLTSILKK